LIPDIQQQIEELRGEIVLREAMVASLEAEIRQIEQELAAFTERYNQLIRPRVVMLDAVKAAITELEDQRRLSKYGDFAPLRPSSSSLPPDYVSVEEQYRRKWQTPPVRPARPPSPLKRSLPGADPAEVSLKHLYRALARRYHPDLASDDDDRRYRNDMMARINDAYASQDAATLQFLTDQPEHVSANTPLAILQLRDLRRVSDELAERIEDLQAERDAIYYGEMMKLNLEDKLARMKGHDLLKEISGQLAREYDESLTRLDALRGGVI
jgi:phage shock protein A